MKKFVYDIRFSDIKLKTIYQNHNIEQFADKMLKKHIIHLENICINVNDGL